MRKIIHVDMDAVYASVEQLDYAQQSGKPVVVAWRGNRSVVFVRGQELCQTRRVPIGLACTKCFEACRQVLTFVTDSEHPQWKKAGL